MNNERKSKYEEPKMSIVVFDAQDILTTSGNGFAGEEEPLIP